MRLAGVREVTVLVIKYRLEMKKCTLSFYFSHLHPSLYQRLHFSCSSTPLV